MLCTFHRHEKETLNMRVKYVIQAREKYGDWVDMTFPRVNLQALRNELKQMQADKRGYWNMENWRMVKITERREVVR